MPIALRLLLSTILSPSLIQTYFGIDVIVGSPDELRHAIATLVPNTRIQVASGTYPGGWEIRDKENIAVEALDKAKPPVFRGGNSAFHFVNCRNLSVRHIHVSEQTGNGLNIDDGGAGNDLIEGVTVEHVTISDIGPRGNRDALKCSGITKFTISHCELTGWAGQGIDCVGCHFGKIEGCTFRGKENYSPSAAIQLKGGSSHIEVRQCKFYDAGERAINVGGSTGKLYFRPRDATAEASDITVRNCHIEGSLCAAAFVGVQQARFENNFILHPRKWVFRTLQENREAGFAGSLQVTIERNQIVFLRSQVAIELNVGNGADPNQLNFKQNQWFAEDQPEASRPKALIQETDGRWGTDPRIAPAR